MTSVKRRQALSLAVVIAGALLLPLGLRAINAALLGAEARSSYLPTLETPRPREAFDAAAALREAQPEFLVIGDSMAGVRIDPRHLSRVTGRSVAGLGRSAGLYLFLLVGLYSIPLWIYDLWADMKALDLTQAIDAPEQSVRWPRVATQAALCGVMVAAILTLRSQTALDFIYFAF